MARSVNKATILGNLTRDPEMRYTPSGSAVTTFGVATNRAWTDREGQQQEAAEFHNIVAWNKLAELCAQLLKKGVRVYVEGRLQTRNWEDAQGVRHYKTEIVARDMVVLGGRRNEGASADDYVVAEAAEGADESGSSPADSAGASPKDKKVSKTKTEDKVKKDDTQVKEAASEKADAKGKDSKSAEESVGDGEIPF